MQKYNYELFADYHQFYIQDDDEAKGDLGDSWSQEAVDRLLATASGTVGVGTVRNMDVPVSIEVHKSNPNINMNDWEHVVLCSLQCDTGSLVVAGCTDYFPDAARISVAPCVFDVLVCFKGLNTLSEDGLDGDDQYYVFLYPGEPREVTVLKSGKNG